MYKRAHGIIETLSPLHVGATAGEESGNLNLIFRDQFTQTGIIPASSLRGRFRADMRQSFDDEAQGNAQVNYWYGEPADSERSNVNNESVVKFEHASIIWFPVFSPGQPMVWVSSPRLLKRYKRITEMTQEVPEPYTGSRKLRTREARGQRTLFFNIGFLTIDNGITNLSAWFPNGEELPAVVVDDADIGMIHDMALYRQSRVRLKENQKVVDGNGFFNTEALPEGTILVFPIALRKTDATWNPFNNKRKAEMYLGGLESIGFGYCELTLKGV